MMDAARRPGDEGRSPGLAALDWVALPGRESADPLRGAEAHGVAVRIVRIPSAGARTPHRHPRSAEVVHVLEGHGVAWRDGARRRVGPGDTLVVPRGVPHATVPAPNSTLLLVCFFPDEDLATNLEELPGPPVTPEPEEGSDG